MKNPCLSVALAELAAHGIRDVVIVHGSKHPQVRFRVNGGSPRAFTIPASPSDWRAPHNTKSDLRRLLKELGVITAPEPKPSAAPCRQPDRISILERRVAALEMIMRGLRGATP
jgi:hypothetical protein